MAETAIAIREYPRAVELLDVGVVVLVGFAILATMRGVLRWRPLAFTAGEGLGWTTVLMMVWGTFALWGWNLIAVGIAVVALVWVVYLHDCVRGFPPGVRAES